MSHRQEGVVTLSLRENMACEMIRAMLLEQEKPRVDASECEEFMRRLKDVTVNSGPRPRQTRLVHSQHLGAYVGDVEVRTHKYRYKVKIHPKEGFTLLDLVGMHLEGSHGAPLSGSFGVKCGELDCDDLFAILSSIFIDNLTRLPHLNKAHVKKIERRHSVKGQILFCRQIQIGEPLNRLPVHVRFSTLSFDIEENRIIKRALLSILRHAGTMKEQKTRVRVQLQRLKTVSELQHSKERRKGTQIKFTRNHGGLHRSVIVLAQMIIQRDLNLAESGHSCSMLVGPTHEVFEKFVIKHLKQAVSLEAECASTYTKERSARGAASMWEECRDKKYAWKPDIVVQSKQEDGSLLQLVGDVKYKFTKRCDARDLQQLLAYASSYSSKTHNHLTGFLIYAGNDAREVEVISESNGEQLIKVTVFSVKDNGFPYIKKHIQELLSFAC